MEKSYTLALCVKNDMTKTGFIKLGTDMHSFFIRQF